MLRKILVSCVLLVLLGGCHPYQVAIEQGNCLDQKRVAALKVGMTKAEVKDILGERVLTSLFDQNCWEYPYFLGNNEKTEVKRNLALWFKNGRLVKIEQQDDSNSR